MADKTNIEWCDSTWNPVIGCTKVSPACDHCYAETLMDKRHGRVTWGGPRVRTKTWGDPIRWQKDHEAFFVEHGRRRRVFCASLADVFDNQWEPQWRSEFWDVVRKCPDLDWLLLTKRPQNIAKMLPAFWGEIRERVWLGISTENQTELERRSQALRDVFAERFYPAVLFSSAEPLLGSLDFTKSAIRFDWIIAGGESGPGARPTHPDWIRGIRDQCEATGTAFLFKQWGEWIGVEELRRLPGGAGPGFGSFDHYRHDQEADTVRIGKKAAGRLLDGVTHDGFPDDAEVPFS